MNKCRENQFIFWVGMILMLLVVACWWLMDQERRTMEAQAKTQEILNAGIALKHASEALKNDAEGMRSLLQEMFGADFDIKKLKTIYLTVTSYNPVSSQCDSTPLSAAFGNLVKPGMIAMPQAFRKKIGLKPFQIVWIEGIGPMQVADHMNDRYGVQPRADIICFIPKWSKKWGSRNLKMYWQEA